MKRIQKTLVLTLVLVFSLSLGQAEAKKVELKLNLQKGQKYSYEMVVKQEITQNMGQEITIHNETVTNYSIEVLDMVSDVYTLQFTYDRLKMKMSNPMTGDMNFDTDSEEESNFNTMFNKLMDLEITILIDKEGNVENVELDSAKLTEMFSAAGVDQMVMQQFNKLYDQESIKGSMQGFLPSIPKKKVKEGTKWDKEDKINPMFPMSIKSDFEVTKVDDGVVSIKENSVITATGPAGIQAGPGMDMSVDLEGGQEGTKVFSIDCGMLKEASVNNSISGDMIISGDQLPEEMAIPMTIITKTTTKRIK